MKPQQIDEDFKILLKQMMEEGYINKNQHATAPIAIYNYTQQTQFEYFWNEATLQCRGLILDDNYNIVSRPFPKFFNLGENQPQEIPLHEPFDVYEKMDGSLGISYFLEGVPYVASRGSFTSEQAVKATELLHQQYAAAMSLMNPNFTYLFEIIYPTNRIVVDYGTAEKLVLLGVLNTATGMDQPLVDIGIPVVTHYKDISSVEQLKELEQDNQEGFVVRFKSGYRVKIKFDEYKRLHRLMSGVSTKSIWELLKEGKTVIELIEHVPDEFYDWVKATEKDLMSQFRAIENTAKAEYKTFETRKETASYFLTCTYPAVLFSMLDQKDYAPKIWYHIRPKYERPFSERNL